MVATWEFYFQSICLSFHHYWFTLMCVVAVGFSIAKSRPFRDIYENDIIKVIHTEGFGHALWGSVVTNSVDRNYVVLLIKKYLRAINYSENFSAKTDEWYRLMTLSNALSNTLNHAPIISRFMNFTASTLRPWHRSISINVCFEIELLGILELSTLR